MKLDLARHFVKNIRLAGQSCFTRSTLFVDKKDIETLVSEESCIRLVRIAVVNPGQRVRLAPVLDVVEPRAKDDPEASAFPGWTGPPVASGFGRTHVLAGMALVGVGQIEGAQQGLIDMGPEAAPYCPFARTHNLVLVFESGQGVDRLTADDAIRKSLLRVAEYLGTLARSADPDQLERWQWPPVPCNLPRTAVVYMIQSQGDLRRNYLYGQPADSILPTLLDPLEVLDGAVVSGNFVLPSNKSCTYIHQNHPLVNEMLCRHGSELDFAGVILANEMSRLADKERSAQFVGKLARLLNASGVVINQEGGGNTVTDIMMLCRLLTRSNIKTVLLVNEFAGADGTTPSLTETTPEAMAIISAGNNDHQITLLPVNEFIGFSPFPGVEGNIAGEITVPLSRIYVSTNQLGFNALSCMTK